jgi:ABC-type transport system substrate-binding protein
MKYPLSLPEVRWAISHGINRSRYVAMGFGLVSTERLSWFPQYPGIQKYVSDDILEKYPFEFNPSKSTEIFEELGFERGNDGIFITSNGTKLEYDFLCLEVTPEIMAFCNDMQNIGISMTPRAFSWGAYWPKHGGLDYDLAYYWASIPAISTPYTWYRQFVSANWREPGVDVPEGRNRERYRNPEYDALVEEVRMLPDDDPRAMEIWDELLEIFLRDLITIPIEWHMATFVLNTKYWTNWPTPYNGTNPYGTPKIGVAKFLPIVFNLESRKLGKIYAEDLIPTEVIPETEELDEALKEVQDNLADIETSLSEVETNIEALSSKVGGQNTTLYAALALSIVAILVSIATYLMKRQ